MLMVCSWLNIIFDVGNLCDKINVRLLLIWTCPVRHFFCKSWLPEPKVDCPGQSDNLIVAPRSVFDQNLMEGRFLCDLVMHVHTILSNFKLADVKENFTGHCRTPTKIFPKEGNSYTACTHLHKKRCVGSSHSYCKIMLIINAMLKFILFYSISKYNKIKTEHKNEQHKNIWNKNQNKIL